jgi:DNA polymerase III subunit epsilon
MSRSVSTLTLIPDEITQLLKLFPQGLVAVDLETTGLSPLMDKIIEMAAIKITAEGKIETFHSLINPLIEIPCASIKFHGLTNQDVASAPTIKRPIKNFWEFAQRLPIVAHNSIFDIGYLIKASHDFQIQFPPLDIYDSCRWARAAWKQVEIKPKNYKLSTLSEYCGFSLKHHVALDDTLACLKIMARISALEVNQELCKTKSYIFRLSQFNSNDCFNFSTRLKGLAQLVQNQELISIVAKGEKRFLRPIGLMPQPKGPVLFAEDLASGLNKTFQLKKIKSFEKLQASYLKTTEHSQ